jgi:hypothetical protein
MPLVPPVLGRGMPEKVLDPFEVDEERPAIKFHNIGVVINVIADTG